MLDTVFYIVLNMSITSSVVGLIILSLRRLNFMPKLGVYWLWSFVLIKLLLPFSISSRTSLLNLAGSFVKRLVPLPGTENANIRLSMSNSIGAAKTYFPVTYSNNLDNIFGTAAVIWAVGALAGLLLTIAIYLLSNRQIKGVVHHKDNIYTGGMISEPVTIGLINQKILVPPEYLEDPRLNYIILHENIHVRRHDNLIRCLAIITACLHWFNPLVWLFLKAFTDDMEFTCDSRAVKSLSEPDRKGYASALLSVGTGSTYSLFAAFGKSGIRARVLNVINYKRLSVFTLVLLLFFIAAASAVLLTNPVK